MGKSSGHKRSGSGSRSNPPSGCIQRKMAVLRKEGFCTTKDKKDCEKQRYAIAVSHCKRHRK